MREAVSSSYRRGVVLWVDGARRLRLLVILASLALTGWSTGYVVTHIRINTDTTEMISPELPFRRLSAELSRAFPQFSDNILVVVEGQTPDLADDAADAFAERLRLRPELFGTVFDPEGDPFFRRNGLLYLDIEDLFDLSDRLAETQPFLGTLWADPSLRGLFDMIGLAIDERLEEDDGIEIELDRVLDATAAVVEAQASNRFAFLSWQNLMRGKEEEEEIGRRFLLIQPALDFGALQPADEAMAAMRGVAKELKLVPEHGVRVRLTGSAALSNEEFKSVEEGMGLAGALSLSFVVLLLSVGLRSWRLAGPTLVTLLMGLSWTAGFAIVTLGQLNLISVAFAVLFIGLSVDFGIHFCLRYQERLWAGDDHVDALRLAAGGVGGALGLCALTSAIAFYSFLPTDYRGLAELGLIAGTGMFIAFISNVTVLPALLTVCAAGPRLARSDARVPVGPAKPLPSTAVSPVQRSIRRHPRRIVYGTLAIVLASTALLPFVRFDFDPLNLKDADTESVRTLRDLMADGEASRYSIKFLAKNLAVAREQAERLEALELVDSAETLADYVPGDQDEKLDVIANMSLFLSPALATARHAPPPDADQRWQAIRRVWPRLERLAAVRAGDTAAALRLLAALRGLFGEGPPGPQVLEELEDRLLSSLPRRLEHLARSLEAEPVSLDSLPLGIRMRNVTADGRARLVVNPKEDMADRDALTRFVEAVRTVLPQATGSPVVMLEAGRTVVGSIREATLIAAVSILVLLIAALGPTRDVLLVFVPVILAGLMTAAATAVLEIPFNYANLIVLPLLFGLSVDFGIHIVLRERAEQRTDGVFGTSTPRAVLFSALTTVGSFGAIALSSHPGTSSMGVLLTTAIAFTLFASLLVLPAVMALAVRRESGVAHR